LLLTVALAGLIPALTGCPPTSYTLGYPGPHPTKLWHARYDPELPEVTILQPDIPPPPEGFPVVIITTPWNQPRVSTLGYAEQLAQWGFVTVSRYYPSLSIHGVGLGTLHPEHVEQVSGLIDWLESENAREDSALEGMLDTTRLGTTGHSLGGMIAIASALADHRVQATVSLDATHDLSYLDLATGIDEAPSAMLMVVAEEGGYCSFPPKRGEAVFDIAHAPAAEVTVAGADHIDFMDTMMGLTPLGEWFCPRGSADPQLVRDLASKYMIAWFMYTLGGEEEWRDFFDGPIGQDDVAQGLVELRTRFETP
jgi:dienelactone hydrolase